MDINYCFDIIPTPDQIIELYENAGFNIDDYHKEKIKLMLRHADLIATAWDKYILAGVARSISDWNQNYYLAELVVRNGYEKPNLGKRLIEMTQARVLQQSMSLIINSPLAFEYKHTSNIQVLV